MIEQADLGRYTARCNAPECLMYGHKGIHVPLGPNRGRWFFCNLKHARAYVDWLARGQAAYAERLRWATQEISAAEKAENKSK